MVVDFIHFRVMTEGWLTIYLTLERIERTVFRHSLLVQRTACSSTASRNYESTPRDNEWFFRSNRKAVTALELPFPIFIV